MRRSQNEDLRGLTGNFVLVLPGVKGWRAGGERLGGDEGDEGYRNRELR